MNLEIIRSVISPLRAWMYNQMLNTYNNLYGYRHIAHDYWGQISTLKYYMPIVDQFSTGSKFNVSPELCLIHLRLQMFK